MSACLSVPNAFLPWYLYELQGYLAEAQSLVQARWVLVLLSLVVQVRKRGPGTSLDLLYTTAAVEPQLVSTYQAENNVKSLKRAKDMVLLCICS